MHHHHLNGQDSQIEMFSQFERDGFLFTGCLQSSFCPNAVQIWTEFVRKSLKGKCYLMQDPIRSWEQQDKQFVADYSLVQCN